MYWDYENVRNLEQLKSERARNAAQLAEESEKSQKPPPPAFGPYGVSLRERQRKRLETDVRQFEVVSIAIDWLESLRESCESGVMDEATARELGGFFHPTLPCECEESGILFCGDPVVVWFHQNHVVVRRVIRSILWTYGFNLRL